MDCHARCRYRYSAVDTPPNAYRLGLTRITILVSYHIQLRTPTAVLKLVLEYINAKKKRKKGGIEVATTALKITISLISPLSRFLLSCLSPFLS